MEEEEEEEVAEEGAEEVVAEPGEVESVVAATAKTFRGAFSSLPLCIIVTLWTGIPGATLN